MQKAFNVTGAVFLETLKKAATSPAVAYLTDCTITIYLISAQQVTKACDYLNRSWICGALRQFPSFGIKGGCECNERVDFIKKKSHHAFGVPL